MDCAASLKDGSPVLVHTGFARDIEGDAGLAQAVEAWWLAIINDWLLKQPVERQRKITGIVPLSVEFGLV